ncbi:CheR family methyltransferase [Paenibacillus senegalensis]|uniref:CheR family methyltransferase n=1 Tax=Paenibacillus senegalensis TaxID=1465766 RepID=UPI0002889FF0|nr:protein-glutamate O-methyltransferase CheR [Paenibacillus senegalensis]
MEDRDFSYFTEQFKAMTAIDLNLYKEAQMKRRLTMFRQKKGFASFQTLLGEMRTNKQLLNEMLDRMTINVSEFFRNPERWSTLEKEFVIPMLQKLPDGSKLKFWSAACSSGEEPYTLMMLLDRLGAVNKSEVLATDLDKAILNKAMQGSYVERALREVSSDLRKLYFTYDQGMYHFSPQLKSKVVFRQHNLLEDSFENGFDLIICRNVMIYFTEEAKRKLYQKFATALKPGGILFVGSTEQIFTPAIYNLEPADTFFYRKMATRV